MSKKILYEGKAKQLFETEKPFELVQFFKDDATAFNKKKHEIIDSKGVLNNLISEFIFTYLSNNNIPNHFIERLSPREQLIKKVEIIPIEVVIRNIAAGTFSNRFGIEEGKNAGCITVGVARFGWAKEDEIETMKKYAFEINILLKKLFKKINITLVDFKIEFGRYYTNNNYEIILADEISPDSCRLWDMSSNEKLDKDRFRRNIGGLIEAYKEVATRLEIDLSDI